MDAPDALHEIAGLLSDRLASWQAHATALVSSGYPLPHWNGRNVIRMEIRPELRGRVDREWDLFAQENALLVQLERECPGCFSWDDGRYAEPRLLGEHGISHYLCDMEAAAQVIAAIRLRPALTPEQRARLLCELIGRPAA